MIGARFSDILAEPVLLKAVKHVRMNDGAPGPDGITTAMFDERRDLELLNLARDVKDGRYRPGGLRTVRMRKANGKLRELGIPNVRDRVLQSATLSVLVPRIDPLMHKSSFAYRPGRGVRDALAFLNQGGSSAAWISDLDISDYFGTILHERLLGDMAFWVSDPDLFHLMSLWISVAGRKGKGIAQGSPISPFLSNLFLHPVDVQLDAMGVYSVRYADDILLTAKTRSAVRAASRILCALLDQRGLRINTAKSQLVAPCQSFKYLGLSVR